ncbi:MAG: GDSL-type esterase/lipase family protein [Anaerolineae bacterium]|nr:GDSL-type esterase/lipase family protein [Anaerolineae bacterium]NUQ04246.1 SH3 domain-containing protein [Anaerolineae bacterium]
MKRLCAAFAVTLILLAFAGSALMQDPASPSLTSAFQDINVRQGPGTTYPTQARLRTGVPVQIIERNSVGTWVHVQQTLEDGTIFMDGWVVSGFLNLSVELRFSQVPVSTLADALPENAESPALRALYSAPIISPVSEAMRVVYQRGLEMRNYSHVVTKIGDSVSADPLYLTLMSRPGAALGPYDYLQDSLDYFGASTQVESVAARIGLNTYALFDAGWASPDTCQQGETPLECELRRKQPSVALIMFGGNDVKHINEVAYDQQMRRLVEETLAKGVIPVLSTFSANPNDPNWWKAVEFNNKVIQIAADYQLPLINLWLASRPLDGFGLEQDGIHMNHWGTDTLRFDNGFPAFSGANLRNLLALRMLDEIRRTIFLDPTAQG